MSGIWLTAAPLIPKTLKHSVHVCVRNYRFKFYFLFLFYAGYIYNIYIARASLRFPLLGGGGGNRVHLWGARC